MLHQIIEHAQYGNKEHMEFLINQFNPLLVKYGNKLGEDGYNIMIVFFIDLIKKMPQKIIYDGMIVNYINLSVRNHYCWQVRRHSINKNVLFSNFDIESINYDENKYNEVLMRCLLKKLPPLQAEIIKKIYFYEMSEVEIANEKNVTRQYIHNLKSKALITLRKILDDSF